MFNQVINTTGFDVPLHKYGAILSNPVKLQNFMRRNKKELFSWGLLVVGLITIYVLFSDGDFSFLLTVAGLIQMFGFFLISLRVQNKQSVSGLSRNTQICYAISFFSRLCSVIPYQGYLPFDSSGDFVYRIGECLGLILALYIIFMATIKHKNTYDWDLDRINCIYLIVPAFTLACLIHPGLNRSYFGDISWTFSLYLESVAMLPQLYMLSKKGGEVESFTSHFVASQGIARAFAFFFWACSFNELNIYTGNIWSLFKGYVGYFVLLAQILQLVLFSDFLYQYYKSMKRGLPMTIQSYLV